MLKLIITITMLTTVLLCQAQVSETRKAVRFSKIEVASGIELYYKEMQGEASIKVEANEGNLSNVITEVNGETLKISATGKAKKENQTIKVYVAATDIESFKAISKSRIVFENMVHAENISIVLETGAYFKGYFKTTKDTRIETGTDAEFNGRIETASFVGTFKNQSRINISGDAKRAVINSSSKANCNARNFLTENTEVNSDDSIVSITCKNKINVNATEHAIVTYFGSPKKANIEHESSVNTKKHIRPLLIAME